MDIITYALCRRFIRKVAVDAAEIIIDKNLTQEGAAADSKAAGDEIRELGTEISGLDSRVTSNTSSISNLNTAVSNNSTSISNLNTKVSNLQTQLENFSLVLTTDYNGDVSIVLKSQGGG